VFSIGLKKEDMLLCIHGAGYLLNEIKDSFGVHTSYAGSIYMQGSEVVRYHVTSEMDLEVIINHFDKYPLISQKQTDFLLFKQSFDLIKMKSHLTLDGLIKIVEIKALMN